MAGCKPNHCYNIIRLYGYFMLYTCSTTLEHTTPTHNPNTNIPISGAVTANMYAKLGKGLCVLRGVCVGVLCGMVALHVCGIR